MESRIENQSTTENKNPVISVEELNQIVQILSQNFKVKMKASDGWAYDFNNNTVLYKKEDLLNRSRKYVIGVLLHENGHIENTDMSVIEDKFKGNDTFFALHNCIEDMRVGELLQKKYKGAGEYLREIYDQDYGPASEYGSNINKLPEHLQFGLGAIYEWHYDERDPFIESVKVQKLLKDLKPDIQKAYKTDSAKKSYEIIRDKIWPHFEKLANESKKNLQLEIRDELMGKGFSRHEAEGRSKELVDQKMHILEKELNDKLETKSVEVEEEGVSPTSKIGEKLNILIKEPVKKNQEKGKEEVIEKKRERMAGGILGGSEEAQIIDPKDADYLRYYRQVSPYINGLARQLKSILKDNDLARYESGYRSGRLSQRQLWRIPGGAVDVFERARQLSKKNYNFSLVIDESGSMVGDNINNAIMSAILVGEAIHKVISDVDIKTGIGVEISGFDTSYRVHKRFDQPLTKKSRTILIKDILKYINGGTNDGMALQQALRSIRNRDGEKLIMMLSDGHGAGDPPIADVLNMVPKDIFVLGVGIGGGMDYVKEVYPRHILVKEVSELSTVFSNIVRSRFRRGV